MNPLNSAVVSVCVVHQGEEFKNGDILLKKGMIWEGGEGGGN